MAHSSTGYPTTLPLADVPATHGVGRVEYERQGRLTAEQVARFGCWSHTSTSGVRQVDQPARADIDDRPGSRRATATTTAATRGSSSATRATRDGRVVRVVGAGATSWTTGRIIPGLPPPHWSAPIHVDDRQRHWPGQHYLIRCARPTTTPPSGLLPGLRRSDPLVRPSSSGSRTASTGVPRGRRRGRRRPRAARTDGGWFRWNTYLARALPGRRTGSCPRVHDPGRPTARPLRPARVVALATQSRGAAVRRELARREPPSRTPGMEPTAFRPAFRRRTSSAPCWPRRAGVRLLAPRASPSSRRTC